MTHEYLAEAGLAAQFGIESEMAQIGYAALQARQAEAAGAIADALLPQIMCSIAPPEKEPDTRYALCWLLDGDISDNELNFATRVALRIRPAPEDVKPRKVAPPPDALVDKKYTPAKKWSEEAKRLGTRGLFLMGIDAVVKTPLTVMTPEETVKSARGCGQFTHLTGARVRYKADPQDTRAERHQTVRPLPSFDSVLATAYGEFVVKHAKATMAESVRADFTDAAEQDRRTTPPSDTLRLREAARGVTDAMERINALAQLTYGADSDPTNQVFLIGLLNSSVDQIASLARLDSGAYHILRSQQPDRAGLYHRLGWIQDNAPFFQKVMRLRMNRDLSGFVALLEESMQAVGRTVADAEELRVHLEPPETMAFQSPDWRVERAH